MCATRVWIRLPARYSLFIAIPCIILWIIAHNPGLTSQTHRILAHGKEAVTVRQLLLVIVLVAAAFAGGAFVNGPALQWAQHRVFRSLGWNEADIASIDLKVGRSSDSASEEMTTSKAEAKPSEVPSAPVPSLVAESDVTYVEQPSEPRGGTSSQQKNQGKSQRLSDRSLPPATSRSLTQATPQVSLEGSASLDRNIKPASSTPLSVTSSASPTKSDPAPAILNLLSDLVPMSKPTNGLPLAGLPLAEQATKQNTDWQVIIHKMQRLGVSKYTLEGETAGHVVFSCLIPVAGRQAITQRFEAEGSDLSQAVEATLRRIILWQAAQPTMPSETRASE
jgi:hypothetical protein